MVLLLRESDKPRTLASKLTEYLRKPAPPIPRLMKDGIQVSTLPSGGRRVDFSVRQGAPWPYFYNIFVRANGSSHGNPQFEEATEFDHIGPFSIDDWSLEITGWRPDSLTLKVGLIPFEIETDRVRIVL